MIVIPRTFVRKFFEEKWFYAVQKRRSSSVYYRVNPGVKAFIRCLRSEQQHVPVRVLDLGCGDGRFVLKYARAGFRVTGVDFSEHAIKQLLQHAKLIGYSSRVHGVVADIKRYHYPIERFDGVSCTNVLHYFQSSTIKKLIRKMQNTTKDNGCHYLAFETDIDMRTSDRRSFMFEGQYSLTSKQLGFVSKLYQGWKLMFSSVTENRIRPRLPPTIQKLINTKDNFYLRAFSVVDFVFEKTTTTQKE